MAFKGRELLIQIDTGGGYVTVGKLQSKTLTLTHESIDVTDLDSNDWRVLDGRGLGTRTIAVAGAGILDQDNAVHNFVEDAVYNGTVVDMKVIMPNGDFYSGNFKIPSFDYSGEVNGVLPFNMSAESSGAISLTRV